MKQFSQPIRRFFFLIFLFVAVLPAVRAQQMIDEDFLDNIEANAKLILDEAAPAFAINAIPDKWKNESAVVVGYKRSILFDKKSSGGFFSTKERGLFFFEKVRFKIKLNDPNAVETFSEIYFRFSDKEDGFIARIIKSTGEILTVDLSDAVSIESGSDMPEFFKSFFDQIYSTDRRYFKVAVPNLDPGDILEYMANTKSKLTVAVSGYIEFTPQYEVCSKNYPVMHNEIIIETDEKSYFKSISLNGAPEFIKEPTEDKNFSKYVFVDKDRATEKDVNFVREFLVYPLVKFQVTYANNTQFKGALIGKNGEIKKGFSKEELAKKAWEDYESTGNYAMNAGSYMSPSIQNFVNESWNALKKLGAKDWSEKDFLKNAYYYIRNKVLFQSNYLSDKTYAFILGSLLFQRDIKSELVITTSNQIGSFKDILFENEIRYVIKVNNQLYFNCTDHSNPGELVESLLGNESYIIGKPAKNGTQEIKPFNLPDAVFSDNSAGFLVNTSISSDMNTINVSRSNSYKGISKARSIDDAMKFTPYMLDDYKLFGGNDPTEGMRGNQQVEYDKSIKALKDEYKKQKPDFVKEDLQREYRQKVIYKDFKIISDGRSQKKSDLVYTEDFELPGMVRKAGKKYLVNLTGLVGPQLQIKDEQRDRKLDISVGYARTLNWVINFKIPDGYTVDGLKELNTAAVENETGKFSCEAKEENGTIIITITKIYKQATISKSKWKEMLQFIDAAYNNSFKYILLKPKN